MEAFEQVHEGERMTDTPIHHTQVRSVFFKMLKVHVKSNLILFSLLIHIPGLMERIHTAAKYGCHSSSGLFGLILKISSTQNGIENAFEIPI